MFKKPKAPSPVEPVAAPLTTEKVAVLGIAPPEPSAKALYEVADFAALDDDQVAELTGRAAQDAAAGLAGCAHLVVTQDLSTGVVHHHVPVSSGREALLLAAQIVSEKQAEESGRRFSVTVTPLLPHTDR